jgi:hypothetical protein
VSDSYDIQQRGGVALVTLAGAADLIGTVLELDPGDGWRALSADKVKIGDYPTRKQAAEATAGYWRRYNEGATECSPTSPRQLARELHRLRGHSSPVKQQVNWLCECTRDANLLNLTDWLRDVVEALGGRFPEGGLSRG